jgi:hypothetical protein
MQRHSIVPATPLVGTAALELVRALGELIKRVKSPRLVPTFPLAWMCRLPSRPMIRLWLMCHSYDLDCVRPTIGTGVTD